MDHNTKKILKLQIILVPILIATIIFSIGIGAVEISPLQVISILFSKIGFEPFTSYNEQQEIVLTAIRLPRVILGVLVGAALAVAGASMQGLFRNPLADPGLLGVSSGASLFVAMAVVMEVTVFGIYTLPIAAFIGSMLTITVIFSLAQQDRKTNISTMLLAGIAINALCGSGTGLFTYLSTDEQLRTITFWQLGSLGGANWQSIITALPFILFCLIGMPFMANSLNALLLGENNARHLGVPVEIIKWIVIALVAFGVGASVAVSGMIGFVGLVVPHLIRLWLGPNHKTLLIGSALLGSILLVLADLISRTIISPVELPIGIVTSLTGAPFFLFLLLKNKKASIL